MNHDGIGPLRYVAIEPDTYLVVPAAEDMLEPYCVAAGERSRIPGLLPMRHQTVNGEFLLYYTITGKRRVRDAARGLGPREGRQLLTSLVRSLQGLPEYFLRADMCLLDVDCLYVDDLFSTYLPLVPRRGIQGGSDPAVRELLLAVVGDCLAGGVSDPYFDRMLKLLLPTGFRLETFAKGALEEDSAVRLPPQPAAPAPEPPAPAVAPPVLERGAGEAKKKREEKPAPAPGQGFAVPGQNRSAPGQGFAVPGQPAPAPEEKAPAKEKKAGGFKVFGLSLGKKKAEALDMGAPSAVPAPPVPQVSRPSPEGVPAPEWSGTVQLSGDGATVFMGSAAHSKPAALIHGGRRVEMAVTPFTVGRMGCSYIVDSPKVSRLHLTITQKDGAYFVSDENSYNHTYLDGLMLPPYTPHPLKNGARLRLGDVELRVELA